MIWMQGREISASSRTATLPFLVGVVVMSALVCGEVAAAAGHMPEGHHMAAAASSVAIALAPASGSPHISSPIDLSAKGYVKQEYFVSGTANRYRIKDPLATAQLVDGNRYTTRTLVRRPTNLAKFNGIVVVEWLNVTAGQDVDATFSPMRHHLTDNGYAWVGVSAQLVGTDNLNAFNPARYSQITMTADNTDPVGGGKLDDRADVLSWDAYTQIGAALRHPRAVDPLNGLKPKLVLAIGESQSAMRLTSYYNSILPLYPQVYDGFLAYDRAGKVRTDMKRKLLSIASELSFDQLGLTSPADSGNVRVWEVAGASHVSFDESANYLTPGVAKNRAADTRPVAPPPAAGLGSACAVSPMFSRVPNGHALNAGIEALVAWIRTGKARPVAPRLVKRPDGQLDREGPGKTRGGIRYADYAVPTSVNEGTNTGAGFCFLMGSHKDFTPAELCKRYGTPKNYLAQMTAAVRRNEREGFLLKSDGARTLAEARKVMFDCGAPAAF